MNYYGPLELMKDGVGSGLWHYTRTHNDITIAVGYCAENCPGHATPEEAREHYKQYMLDTALDLNTGTDTKAQHPCEICGGWCQTYATVGGMPAWYLCDAHRTKEGVASIYRVGNEISSY